MAIVRGQPWSRAAPAFVTVPPSAAAADQGSEKKVLSVGWRTGFLVFGSSDPLNGIVAYLTRKCRRNVHDRQVVDAMASGTNRPTLVRWMRSISIGIPISVRRSAIPMDLLRFQDDNYQSDLLFDSVMRVGSWKSASEEWDRGRIRWWKRVGGIRLPRE
jgi:hypothetical protein